jgi:phosphatidylinositol alpha-1,6-mannosyltransferase
VVVAGQIRRAGPIARLWSIATRRPYYLWVYGGETSPDFTRSSWATSYLQRVLRGAHIVFTISPYTTRLMSEFGLPEAQVVEIPLGAGEDLRPQAKDPDYVARLALYDKLVFLTVGRLVERKGVDTMLRALAELDRELPPWRYLVVSDGPYRAALEGMAADLGIDDKVTFTGHVEERELPTYYNLCDVFCMPNRQVVTRGGASLSVEGFGMVFVDAAACGKPVIGGRSGGAVDAVSHRSNGFLVAPGDVQDLKDAILRLADAGLRETMGAAGREFAARFQWDRSANVLRPYLTGEERRG